MEFLRFGSSIPGSYWGCCAVDIIQNFQYDPEDKASIQLVYGDGGMPVSKDGEQLFAGPTYEDIFWQRMRVGTFDTRPMPNHGFIAILTANQLQSDTGKKWLKILHKAGFEFLRAVSNSVYTGSVVTNNPKDMRDSSVNYIFGLFRNVGTCGLINPYQPPKAWADLGIEGFQPNVIPGDDGIAQANSVREMQFNIWEKTEPKPFLTEEEVRAAGAPVILAGRRTIFLQQTKDTREALEKKNPGAVDECSDPFAPVDDSPDDYDDEESFL